jgi:hypothetical protein
MGVSAMINLISLVTPRGQGMAKQPGFQERLPSGAMTCPMKGYPARHAAYRNLPQQLAAQIRPRFVPIERAESHRRVDEPANQEATTATSEIGNEQEVKLKRAPAYQGED